jgi:hypothetical protein
MPRDVKPASPLPAPDTARWTHRRKAAVVIAIRAGKITSSEAREHYRLSLEELVAWEEAFDQYGIDGLNMKTRRWILWREREGEPTLRASPISEDPSPGIARVLSPKQRARSASKGPSSAAGDAVFAQGRFQSLRASVFPPNIFRRRPTRPSSKA